MIDAAITRIDFPSGRNNLFGDFANGHNCESGVFGFIIVSAFVEIVAAFPLMLHFQSLPRGDDTFRVENASMLVFQTTISGFGKALKIEAARVLLLKSDYLAVD